MPIGMKNGEMRSGPRVALMRDLLDERARAAQPGADDRAGSVGQLAFEPLRQPGLVHRLARRDERELRVAVVAPDLLAVEHVRRVEVDAPRRRSCS